MRGALVVSQLLEGSDPAAMLAASAGKVGIVVPVPATTTHFAYRLTGWPGSGIAIAGVAKRANRAASLMERASIGGIDDSSSTDGLLPPLLSFSLQMLCTGAA